MLLFRIISDNFRFRDMLLLEHSIEEVLRGGNVMEKKCLAFDMEDVGEAWKHMELEIIEDYGDRAYGHFLHM